MKYGVEPSNWRATGGLADEGYEVGLCALQRNGGLYDLLVDWNVCPAEPRRLILGPLRLVFRKPCLHMRLLPRGEGR